MENQENSTFNMSSAGIIVFLYDWRKVLITVSIVAAIVSAVVSLLIENKYKSSVILFPTTTNSISKALIADNFGGKDDILELGEEVTVFKIREEGNFSFAEKKWITSRQNSILIDE